jgi:hypothetical protein
MKESRISRSKFARAGILVFYWLTAFSRGCLIITQPMKTSEDMLRKAPRGFPRIFQHLPEFLLPSKLSRKGFFSTLTIPIHLLEVAALMFKGKVSPEMWAK